MKKTLKKIGMAAVSFMTMFTFLFYSASLVHASSVTLDGAAVSTLQTLGSGTVTSPSFNTSGTNEGIIVFIEEGGTGVPLVSTVTGCSLTFKKQAQIKASTDANVEIWTAFAASKLTSCSIQANAVSATSDMYITVQAVSGEDTTGSGTGMIGATTTAVDLSGTTDPSSVNTTKGPNSWVFANVVDEYTNTDAFTAGTNQTTIGNVGDTSDGFRYAVWKQNANTVTQGTAVTMNGTFALDSDTWSMATIEIKGTSGGAPTPPAVCNRVTFFGWN